MKKSNKILFFYVVIIGVLTIFTHVSGHILMWDVFERENLSPWHSQTHGGGSVDLISENPASEFSHQSHGEKSLRIIDENENSYANAQSVFPSLPESENEFMVELYFYIDRNHIAFDNFIIYKATRETEPSNISLYLQETYDSISRKFWRIRIDDYFGSHFIVLAETVNYWYKIQIHQLESGIVNLWINGDSVGNYVSSDYTHSPDLITIGSIEDKQNGMAYWDDFIVCTPPRNARHPRLFFNADFIPELRSRRTNNNQLTVGVSYKTLWDRRRTYTNMWKMASVPDDTSDDYLLPYPYNEPPTLVGNDAVNWHAIGLKLNTRLELIAFVSRIDADNSPNLIDTLRPCLRAISNWQQWVSPFDTARWGSTLPHEYVGHSTAFITRCLSFAYDYTYDYLTNYERMSIQNGILVLGVGQLYLGMSTYGYWFWGNWGCLYASALGLACLALDDSIFFRDYIDFLFDQYLPQLLSNNSPAPFFDVNGANDEGVIYGTFSCQSLVYLAEAQKNILNDNSLYNHPHIQEYINGFIHLLGSSTDCTTTFGDMPLEGNLSVIMGDVFFMLTSYFQNSLGQWLLAKFAQIDHSQMNHGWPNSCVPQYVFLTNLPCIPPVQTLGITRYFNHIGWMNARSDWSDTALTVSFKCGPAYSGHGYHHDNNNFIIGRKGNWVIKDRGYRYHDFSHYHNVLTVDGQGQTPYSPNNQPERAGLITKYDLCATDTQYIYFEGDASNNYSYIYNGYPLLQKWFRSCVLTRKPFTYFVVFDDIKSDIPRNLDWRLRPSSRSPYYGGDSIFIQNNLLVKFLVPTNPKIDWDENIYDSFPEPDPLPRQANVYNVAPNQTDTSITEAKYLTVFYPCSTVANRPIITRIDGTTMVGAQVKNSVVMFSKSRILELPIDEVEFCLEAESDSVSVLLVHLFPTTVYAVIIKDTTGVILSTDIFTSSSQGTLYFKNMINGVRQVFVSSKIYLADSCATYPNQSRHLDRTVNTQDCYLVFQGENSAFLQERSEVIGEPILIDQGKYPSIAVTSTGHSWVCYTTIEPDILKCAIKRSQYPDDWRTVNVFDWPRPEDISAPSLILATPSFGTSENMGYVVCAMKLGGLSQIRFFAFDSFDVYYDTILDYGSDNISVLAPCIAVTPKDLIHVTWQKTEVNQEDTISRIYYITTLEGVDPRAIRQGHRPVWSEIDVVSTPNNPQTEPAFNPFVEAQGEKVFVVWRGPNEEGNPEYGDIWQREGAIRPGELPEWHDPRNVSQSRDEESNYPTMSTGTAIVWQESLPDLYQIYGEVQGQVRNLSNNQFNSRYPHTNLLPTPPWSQYKWQLSTVWTEQDTTPGIYKIGAGNYYFDRRWDQEEPPITLECGEIDPSIYCIDRLGYIDFGDYSVDYAFELIYKLCYLHPEKYYLLEAICYNDTTIKEKFVFEDSATKTIQILPSDPETLRIMLRPNDYENAECLLKIRKMIGEYAVLANMYLYEFEILEGSGSGPQSLWAYDNYDFIPSTTILHMPIPNPFKGRLLIRYQLAKTSKVSLSIYDVQGRRIRTFINEICEPGFYEQVWDAKDNKGRAVSTGIYFYRIKTDDYQAVNKVVLTR